MLGAGRVGCSGQWLFQDETVEDRAAGGAAVEAGPGAVCRDALFEALPSLPEVKFPTQHPLLLLQFFSLSFLTASSFHVLLSSFFLKKRLFFERPASCASGAGATSARQRPTSGPRSEACSGYLPEAPLDGAMSRGESHLCDFLKTRKTLPICLFFLTLRILIVI